MATVQRFTADLRPSGRGGGGHLVEVPDEIVRALGAKGRLSFTHRLEHAEAIAGAKKPETRTRRLQRAMEQLEGTKPKPGGSSTHNGPDGSAP